MWDWTSEETNKQNGLALRANIAIRLNMYVQERRCAKLQRCTILNAVSTRERERERERERDRESERERERGTKESYANNHCCDETRSQFVSEAVHGIHDSAANAHLW